MKNSLPTLRILAFLAVTVPVVRAEAVAPSLVAAQGDVRVDGLLEKPAYPKTIPAPGNVVTGAGSAAMIVPVPGQLIYLGAATKVQVQAGVVAPDSGNGESRNCSCTLQQGHLHSSIRHPKKGTSVQSVVIPSGTLSAHGTGWATWVDPNGSRFAVYAGVVSFAFGGKNIDIMPGQVGFVTGTGDAAELEIIDLKTGQAMRYGKGANGSAGLASTVDILAARNAFEGGLGAFIGTASDDDKISLSQLMAQINKLLADNHLAPITPPLQFQLFPDWFNHQLTSPAATASPEQPPQ